MTGSGPFTFKEQIYSSSILWSMAWPVHVSSWLVIPALIGMFISAAAEDVKRQQALRSSVRDILKDLGASNDDIVKLENDVIDQVKQVARETFK
jgi:hypothetical protein